MFNFSSRQVNLPGVHGCSVTTKESSLSATCQENTKSRSSHFLAELEDITLGLVTSLMSSTPTFQFSSIRPGTLFNLTIYRKSLNESQSASISPMKSH